ncbi:MAG: GNAT family N-acetyltransferase [Planctomycetaceae bacterium]
MIGVVELQTTESLEKYRITWDDLWRQTLPQSFCSSYAWFSSFARHFLAEGDLRVLVVSVNGKTIGILPLVNRQVETGVGTLRMLTLPRCRWGCIDGPIGPNPTATMLLAMRYLQQTQGEWDLLDLREIQKSGGNHQRLTNSFRTADMACCERPWDDLPVVKMDGQWRDYWISRSSRLKKTAAKSREAFSAKGLIELIRQRKPTPQVHRPNPRLSVLIEGNDNRFATRSHSASAVDLWTEFESVANLPERDLAFLRDVHPQASALGMEDLSILRAGKTPIAAAYGWHVGGHVTTVWIGQRPDLDDSVKSLLIESLLYDSFERGDRELAFRDHEHAELVGWANSNAPNFRYTHFSSNSPRAQILRLNQYVRGWWQTPEPAQPIRPHMKPLQHEPRLLLID